VLAKPDGNAYIEEGPIGRAPEDTECSSQSVVYQSCGQLACPTSRYWTPPYLKLTQWKSGISPQLGQLRISPEKVIAHPTQVARKLAISAGSGSASKGCRLLASSPESFSVPPEDFSLSRFPWLLVLTWSPGRETSDCSSPTYWYQIRAVCRRYVSRPANVALCLGDTASCTLGTQLRSAGQAASRAFWIEHHMPCGRPTCVVSGFASLAQLCDCYVEF